MAATAYADLLGEFLLDARERLARVEETLLASGEAERLGGARLEELSRDLHTVKGGAGMMGLTVLQERVHAMEDLLGDAAGGTASSLLGVLDGVWAALRAAEGRSDTAAADRGAGIDSVRVQFAVLDALMERVAETVIARNRLSRLLGDGAALRGDPAIDGTRWRALLDAMFEVYRGLEAALDEIQNRILQLRLVPLHTLFGPLHRGAFDEARKAGKRVRFAATGGDTPLDKALLDVANEALGHLVRNAVVHGLETPADRRAAGKPAEGGLRLTATTEGEAVRIEVADDGRGIDGATLIPTAARRGMDTAGIRDPFDVLFLPGFSTHGEADLSAGRGVGLAAVRKAVTGQGGRVEVRSAPGEGTRFTLHLPLSVSIIRALLVDADGEGYALPLSAVRESRRFRRGDGHAINGAWVWRWDDRVIPLVDLGCAFGTETTLRAAGYVVVIGHGGKHRGLVLDRLRGMQEVVVRGLDPVTGHPRGIAGSTILGDGRPILMLDPGGLIELEPFVVAAS